MSKESSLLHVFNEDGKLVNLIRVDDNADKPPLDSFEEEIWRIFSEYQKLNCTCNWSQWDMDTDTYDTGCGGRFEFTFDGPKENHFTHCPYCGGKLKELTE